MARHNLKLDDEQVEKLRTLRQSMSVWESRYGRARRHVAMCERQLFGHYDAEASMLQELSTPLLEEHGISPDDVEDVRVGEGGQLMLVTRDKGEAPDP